MKNKLLFAFRVILFLIGFLLVAYGMVFFGAYLGEFRDYYFRAGQWDKALVLAVIVLGIGYVLRKLLLWEYRKEAGIKRRKRK
jgi:amino acid transporter